MRPTRFLGTGAAKDGLFDAAWPLRRGRIGHRPGRGPGRGRRGFRAARRRAGPGGAGRSWTVAPHSSRTVSANTSPRDLTSHAILPAAHEVGGPDQERRLANAWI